jgi:eukaryotic-like serine/threonine-protein kinase
MIGNVVGNYKITEKLGEGGMGAVYKGVDLMLEREVAIKALRPELASQPQVVERFRSEAVTLAKLNHQNIAALYSFFRQGDEFFMVMEFMRGQTLDEIVSKSGAMSCEQAVPLFCHALEGIGYAHRMGIIHRDIKPANMMLTDDGTLKVMDFGIARVLGTARMTRAGNLIGTIEYMSPEQVRGQETDERADIYALGVLLFELLTGRLPFASENEYELMKMQIEHAPPDPRSLAPHIPEAVGQAILKAMAKRPEDRFQSAQEFRDELLNAELPEAVQGALAAARGSATARASKPPVSRPATQNTGGAKETRLAAAATQAVSVPKETRLGDASAAASSAAAAKAPVKGTRLATTPEPAAHANSAARPAASSSINPKLLYIGGAGAAVLVMLVVAVVIALSGGKEKEPENAPAVAAESTPTPAAPAVSQPEQSAPPNAPVSAPVAEQPPVQAVPPAAAQLPPAALAAPGDDTSGKEAKKDVKDDAAEAARRAAERRRAAEAERQRKIKEGLKLLDQ